MAEIFPHLTIFVITWTQEYSFFFLMYRVLLFVSFKIFFTYLWRGNFLFFKKLVKKRTLFNKFHLPKTKTERKSFIYFFIYLQSIRVGKIWLYLENFWILLKVIFLTSVQEKSKDGGREGEAVVLEQIEMK